MSWPRWFPWDKPAFRWGFLNPFGPPPPWWTLERRIAYFEKHGKPWEPASEIRRFLEGDR